MKGTSGRPKVALIAGPTASGKSGLAIRLADAANGAVVNADSMQVYRDLRILTARPSAQDEAAVPHRLFGYIDGAEACSAARWAEDAKREITRLHDEGWLPVLTGGTGLYLRTLLDGIAPIPEIDPDIRTAVRAMPVAQAYAALKAEDADSAARLAPADSARIARALEVVRSTGRPIGAWRREKSGGIGGAIELHPLVLLPDREWLYARCDRRFETMFDDGAVTEVETLLARGLSPELPVMRAIGVPEIADYLAGRIDRTAAIERARLATRQYAKRQYTWFSRQPPSDWSRVGENDYDVLLEKVVRKLL